MSGGGPDDFRTGGAGDVLEELGNLPQLNAGDSLGAYIIDDVLGQGGMATVFRAHRADGAFNQSVAIKVLSRFWANDLILQRFRQEQQILAAMSHPNIATLLDGGFTDQGLPYLAMEIVEGEPVTRYCDPKRLSIRQRIRLVRPVLNALEYAHSRLIVHRDIKPQNILVRDDGVPKLLDFGIAKILAQSDVEAVSDQTGTGIRLLTLEYAAPEQIQARPVTTATDIYQMGLLLYEMLTGRPALDLRGKTLQEAEKTILEVRPPVPSQAAAAQRGAGSLHERVRLRPASLRRILQGDLDTIILKCLAKEPERRYLSISDLAHDLDNYLDGRPISARRDSLGYRASRFIARHPLPIAITSVALATVVGMTSFYLHDLRLARDQAQREAQTAQQMTDFLVRLLKGSDPFASDGVESDLRVLLDRAASDLSGLEGLPAVEERMRRLLSEIYGGLGEVDKAVAQGREASAVADEALDLEDQINARLSLAAALLNGAQLDEAKVVLDDVDVLASQPECCADPLLLAEHDVLKGRLLRETSQFDEAEAAYARALAVYEGVAPDTDDERKAQFSYAIFLLQREQPEQALSVMEGIVRSLEEQFGPDHVQLASPLDTLANTLKRLGRNEEARDLLLRALDLRLKQLGEDHPRLANSYQNLASLSMRLEDYSAMLDHATRAAEIRQAHYGDSNVLTAEARINMAIASGLLGDYATAEAIDRELLTQLDAMDPPPKRLQNFVLTNLADALANTGRHAQARAPLEAALEIARELYGDDSTSAARAEGNLAGLLVHIGQYATAETYLRHAIDIYRSSYGEDHVRVAYVSLPLARLLIETGRVEEALPLVNEALERRTQSYGDSHVLTAVARVEKARAHAAKNETELAIAVANNAIDALLQSLPATDPAVAEAASVAVEAMVSSGQCGAAMDLASTYSLPSPSCG